MGDWGRNGSHEAAYKVWLIQGEEIRKHYGQRKWVKMRTKDIRAKIHAADEELHLNNDMSFVCLFLTILICIQLFIQLFCSFQISIYFFLHSSGRKSLVNNHVDTFFHMLNVNNRYMYAYISFLFLLPWKFAHHYISISRKYFPVSPFEPAQRQRFVCRLHGSSKNTMSIYTGSMTKYGIYITSMSYFVQSLEQPHH